MAEGRLGHTGSTRVEHTKNTRLELLKTLEKTVNNWWLLV